jgi:MFS family permease
MASVNTGTLIIALPDLARSLNIGIFSLVWVLLSYMLAQTALVLMAGHFADMVGRKKLYVGGFALFTLVSFLAGFAGNAWELIVARTLMGAAGAFMMADSAVIVADAFPSKQLGQALGINQMFVAVGSILGPVLGGWLTSFSWQWVFWFNVPLGLTGPSGQPGTCANSWPCRGGRGWMFWGMLLSWWGLRRCSSGSPRVASGDGNPGWW